MRRGKAGEIYNIGANNEKSNLEITKRILSLLSKSELLIKHVEDRKGHDYRYAVDSSKIKNDLGWEAESNFENSIRKTLNWYLDHKNWWQQLIYTKKERSWPKERSDQPIIHQCVEERAEMKDYRPWILSTDYDIEPY